MSLPSGYCSWSREDKASERFSMAMVNALSKSTDPCWFTHFQLENGHTTEECDGIQSTCVNNLSRVATRQRTNKSQTGDFKTLRLISREHYTIMTLFYHLPHHYTTFQGCYLINSPYGKWQTMLHTALSHRPRWGGMQNFHLADDVRCLIAEGAYYMRTTIKY